MVAPPSTTPPVLADGIPEDPSSTHDNDSTRHDDSTREDARAKRDDAVAPLKNRKKSWKKFEEGQKSDWWFASTGIPLLAAALGPLANISSIAALVTSWRMQVYVGGQFVTDEEGESFADPRWCYYLNVGSLICGFLGNIFLLFNFTQRIRYIVALPATVAFWYLATGFLIGITACMEIYAPPNRPYQAYTQGFWYAVAAAALYLLCSMLLMVNMLGFFLGHYSEDFALSDSQRTLILQTMVFFIWLGGGAAVFSKIESDAGQTSFTFVNSLYFADVTILTVGFGDLYPTTNLGRGIVFPFSVGGIIILALIVSSIYKFMREIGEENIIMKHTQRMRERTAERTVTNSFELRREERAEHRLIRRRSFRDRMRPTISAPSEPRMMHTPMGNTVRKITILPYPLKKPRKPRPLLLKEEKDRFEAMRNIQHKTRKYKRWLALVFSSTAFGILWCVGAVVFWQAERHSQGMTYYKALYLCYVSLLTIGYGDLSPKSSAGRVFFVIWSLIAVPTMTILVSDMGDTVVTKFKKLSDQLADFTVLPKEGIWRSFLNKHPWLLQWLQTRMENRAARKRLKRGFEIEDPDVPEPGEDMGGATAGIEEQGDAENNAPPVLAEEIQKTVPGKQNSNVSLAQRIALGIRKVAADHTLPRPKRYEYEEWVEFMQLIRHSRHKGEDEDEEGLLGWDWIGSDSPLVSGLSEPAWLLHHLCESLVRLERKGTVAMGTEQDGLGRVDTQTMEARSEGYESKIEVASGASGNTS